MNFINGNNQQISYKTVHVQENNKTTDIKDALNRLWYKVRLIGTDLSIYAEGTTYLIEVLNYIFRQSQEDSPLIILTIPEIGSATTITDYNEAISIYNECVRDFTLLVKASTRELQDIDIFNEKVGYKCASGLSCCATCKHLHKHRKMKVPALLPDDIDLFLLMKFECWNPKNVVEYNFDARADINNYPFERLNGEIDRYKDLHKAILKPCVNLLCICNNFEKRN